MESREDLSCSGVIDAISTTSSDDYVEVDDKLIGSNSKSLSSTADAKLQMALSGREPTVPNLIEAAICVLKKRKARPNAIRICSWINRRFGQTQTSITEELERMVASGRLFRINCKGGASYRIRKNNDTTTTAVATVVSGSQESPLPLVTLRTLVLDLLHETGVNPTYRQTIDTKLIAHAVDRSKRPFINRSAIREKLASILEREVAAGFFIKTGDDHYSLPPVIPELLPTPTTTNHHVQPTSLGCQNVFRHPSVQLPLALNSSAIMSSTSQCVVTTPSRFISPQLPPPSNSYFSYYPMAPPIMLPTFQPIPIGQLTNTSSIPPPPFISSSSVTPAAATITPINIPRPTMVCSSSLQISSTCPSTHYPPTAINSTMFQPTSNRPSVNGMAHIFPINAVPIEQFPLNPNNVQAPIIQNTFVENKPLLIDATKVKTNEETPRKELDITDENHTPVSSSSSISSLQIDRKREDDDDKKSVPKIKKEKPFHVILRERRFVDVRELVRDNKKNSTLPLKRKKGRPKKISTISAKVQAMGSLTIAGRKEWKNNVLKKRKRFQHAAYRFLNTETEESDEWSGEGAATAGGINGNVHNVIQRPGSMRKKKCRKIFDPADHEAPSRKRTNVMPQIESQQRNPPSEEEVEIVCVLCLSVTSITLDDYDAKNKKKKGLNLDHEPVSSQKMLRCKDCASYVHAACMEYTDVILRNINKAKWQCIYCKTCSICDQGIFNEGKRAAFCDLCDCAYHLRCHKPPLKRDPSDLGIKWNCSKCCSRLGLRYTPATNGTEECNGKTDDTKSCLTNGINGNAGREVEQDRHKQNNSFNESVANETDAELIERFHALLPPPHHQSKNLPVPPNWEDYPVDESIPNVIKWSAKRVGEYIKYKCKLSECEANVFSAQELDGCAILMLHRSDVISNLGLKLGPALKAFDCIKTLQTRRNLPKYPF